MTSWIWMEGVEEAVADPIPPLSKHDKRPSVKDLIVSHKEEIADVKALLQKETLYDPSKHDDLWILRFVLSHKGKVQACVKAVKETLEFRKKYNLDDTDIRYETWSRDSANESVRVYMQQLEEDAMIMGLPDARRGVIFYFDIGGFDYPKMVENVTKEQWMGAFVFGNEWSHQWQDYITRTSGRLTKSIRFIDLHRFKLRIPHREASNRDAHCMGVMEDCYPQLLQALWICNPPSWIEEFWRILRPIFPKRVIEKFDFINLKKSEKDREMVMAYIDLENLPVKFGGKNDTWPPEFKLPPKEPKEYEA